MRHCTSAARNRCGQMHAFAGPGTPPFASPEFVLATVVAYLAMVHGGQVRRARRQPLCSTSLPIARSTPTGTPSLSPTLPPTMLGSVSSLQPSLLPSADPTLSPPHTHTHVRFRMCARARRARSPPVCLGAGDQLLCWRDDGSKLRAHRGPPAVPWCFARCNGALQMLMERRGAWDLLPLATAHNSFLCVLSGGMVRRISEGHFSPTPRARSVTVHWTWGSPLQHAVQGCSVLQPRWTVFLCAGCGAFRACHRASVAIGLDPRAPLRRTHTHVIHAGVTMRSA